MRNKSFGVLGTSVLIIMFIFSAVPNVSLAATVNAVMMDSFFTPQNLTVNTGDTVTWINAGTMAHTVTADDGSFDSGTIQPGGTYSMVFNTPGTYRYYCRFHGGQNGVGMSGMITVGSTGTNVPPNQTSSGYMPGGVYPLPGGSTYQSYNSYPAASGQYISVPTGNVYNLPSPTNTTNQSSMANSGYNPNSSYPYSNNSYNPNSYSYGSYGSYGNPYNSGGYYPYNGYPYSYSASTYPYSYPYSSSAYPYSSSVYPSGYGYDYPYYGSSYGYGYHRPGVWNDFGGGFVQPAAIPISAAQIPTLGGWGW